MKIDISKKRLDELRAKDNFKPAPKGHTTKACPSCTIRRPR